jgi:hypothetical protein
LNFLFWRKKSAKRNPVANYKSATAYLFSDHLMLHSELSTPFGRLASEPFLRVPRDVSPDEIGRAAATVLEASRSAPDTPHGKDFANFYLKSLGVKSNAELQRTALNVSIAHMANNFEFSPTHNGGASGDTKGYRPIPEVSPLSVSADAPAADIGEILLKAFSLCTSVYQ